MDENKKKFLALTGLRSFWDLSKPLIYLGEWCCPVWKEKEWEHFNGEELKDPKLKTANAKEANTYTIEIFEKILPLLSDWLNKTNNVQYSERYWQFLVSPFLLFYIPTIIFWSKETTRLRVTAKPFFDELERVGIYHDSPKSAANMLKKIVDEPCQWWFQPEVQAARDRFCTNFIKTSETWSEDWVKELLKLREKFHSEI